MYYKKINKNNNKDMFEFLKNHFQYYTMNSWNGLKSIANFDLLCDELINVCLSLKEGVEND